MCSKLPPAYASRAANGGEGVLEGQPRTRMASDKLTQPPLYLVSHRADFYFSLLLFAKSFTIWLQLPRYIHLSLSLSRLFSTSLEVVLLHTPRNTPRKRRRGRRNGNANGASQHSGLSAPQILVRELEPLGWSASRQPHTQRAG